MRHRGQVRQGHQVSNGRTGVLMQQVLVSGSAGFIGGYVVEELLKRGYAVVGVDNFSKYGKVAKSYDDHPRYRWSRATPGTSALMTRAAGRLRPLHRRRGHDRRHLLLPHLRLRPARHQRADHRRRRATPRSPRTGTGGCGRSPTCRSSMVFESADDWPSYEGQERRDPAAAVVLRLPEAGGRVLRPGRLGAVRAAVHDRAPVQLRGHRREPRPRRRARSCPGTSSSR